MPDSFPIDGGAFELDNAVADVFRGWHVDDSLPDDVNLDRIADAAEQIAPLIARFFDARAKLLQLDFPDGLPAHIVEEIAQHVGGVTDRNWREMVENAYRKRLENIPDSARVQITRRYHIINTRRVNLMIRAIQNGRERFVAANSTRADAMERSAMSSSTAAPSAGSRGQDEAVRRVEARFSKHGTDGKQPYVKFYKPHNINAATFSAWKVGNWGKCGKEKKIILDKAALALR